jgi:hypothetical protein
LLRPEHPQSSRLTGRRSVGRTETGRFPIELDEVLEGESATCGFPITRETTLEGRFEAFFAAKAK